MIRINLLPLRQIKRKQRLLQELISFVAVIAVLATGLTIWGLGLSGQIGDLQSRISELNQKKASYGPILAQIKKLEADKAILEKKIATIQNLRKNSQVSVRVLDELAAKTPTDRLWLQSLQHTPNRLQLTGVALDNAIIAQYMKELATSPYFAEADLANSSLTVVSGNKLKSFSLTVQIVKPAPKKPAG